MRSQLAAFLEHLRLNRNSSAHTAAAYESDISQFLDFAAQHLDTAADHDAGPPRGSSRSNGCTQG